MFGRLLPIEGYEVTSYEMVPLNYTESLTHLYQPLIGVEAVSLYITLLNEENIQTSDHPQTHHVLMNYLQLPLDKIYEARQKLEGIGLLETYEKEIDGIKTYQYVLKSPFTPIEFFKDGMYSELLYHHLGYDKYHRLRNRFIPQKKSDENKRITASFDEVFEVLQPNVHTDDSVETTNVDAEITPETNKVDFLWLENALKDKMIPFKKVLNSSNRKIIRQMASLYRLETFELEKAMFWALGEDNLLDHNQFKAACHDLFNEKYAHSNMKLQPKRPIKVEKTEQESNEIVHSKEDELIKHFETMSPRQILEDYSSGNQASEQDVKLIRDVMTSQGLSIPVMNVLTHYVLLQSDMKLTRAYLEKIASHWSRSKLSTAKEAMDFAKSELNRRKMKAAEKKQGYRNYYRKEVIPDWMQQNKANKAMNETKKDIQSTEKQKNQQSEKVDRVLDRFIKSDHK